MRIVRRLHLPCEYWVELPGPYPRLNLSYCQRAKSAFLRKLFQTTATSGRICAKPGALLLDLVVLTKPLRKSPDTVFNRGRGPESDVARQIFDVGIGCRYIAGLHRQHLLEGLTTELLLKQ